MTLASSVNRTPSIARSSISCWSAATRDRYSARPISTSLPDRLKGDVEPAVTQNALQVGDGGLHPLPATGHEAQFVGPLDAAGGRHGDHVLVVRHPARLAGMDEAGHGNSRGRLDAESFSANGTHHLENLLVGHRERSAIRLVDRF